MKDKLKKSQITDWWLTEPNNLMGFTNILKENSLNKKNYVVGLDRNDRELSQSNHEVIEITKNGVISGSNTLYPFSEAHELYLQFLVDANEEGAIIASRWKQIMYLSNSDHVILIANIMQGDTWLENQTFDFIPDGKTKAMLTGFSTQLNSKVVLTTFSRDGVCIKIGIPAEIKKDIYSNATSLFWRERPLAKEVGNLVSEKLKK